MNVIVDYLRQGQAHQLKGLLKTFELMKYNFQIIYLSPNGVQVRVRITKICDDKV